MRRVIAKVCYRSCRTQLALSTLPPPLLDNSYTLCVISLIQTKMPPSREADGATYPLNLDYSIKTTATFSAISENIYLAPVTQMDTAYGNVQRHAKRNGQQR
ncbi:hypothetical protein NPIL_313311 [Nephila pilipes]|uniref:Uncharacterized protein n=1 Tax=Nephila pilipes TaxID=299642 RepID=A0A8X6TH44_NEPPI|nr:hypothetical protein NPIL_313311 [Nephila pilipes]